MSPSIAVQSSTSTQIPLASPDARPPSARRPSSATVARPPSPPSPPLPRDLHYAQWPYYSPPPGWVYAPLAHDDPDALWRSFEPAHRRSLRTRDEQDACGHPFGFLPAWSPESGVRLHGGVHTTSGASPFFADVPESVAHANDDPAFAAYTKAQMRAPCDPTFPLVHPALALHAEHQYPELLWDLTAPLDAASLSALTSSALIPLASLELATPAFAPPLRSIRIRLACAPSLAFDLATPRPRAIDLRLLLLELASFLQTQRLTVGEYQALGYRTRHAVAAEHQRRMGSMIKAPAFGDTPYLMRDVFGNHRWFRGLEMRSPSEWWLHTTTRDRCRPESPTPKKKEKWTETFIVKDG
ncbi:hypothetical protein PUNSTDRAFT_44746 [Punctularia strigosozonata HHB-11173 SS5]|uniref:uncharacterized protein n=1 Tax=Punctularia strigosozonata (strain HHB-11173) TaxID=741275 RepID=UPI0004416C53|nr:uncharacterized protein PUNSTDRAFT_44746 [Punctularia strigosozonata HHB-11173 SS5]EIN08145.1 hypothetical protein PUNSTDRAFT_44746 [Punctularia strigosozonata HHB-11173 SS5]